MTRIAALVVAAVALLGLAGCGDGSLVPTAGEAGASPSPSPTASAPPVEPTGAAPAVPAPPATTNAAQPPTQPPAQPPAQPSAQPSIQPSVPPVPPAPTPGSGGPSRALASVRADVERVAPALESFYQDREYPVDLAQVRSTLPEAGVTLAAGNTIAGYDYDGDAVEFELCVESTTGAFAAYDTAPMSLRRSGETGGCPG